MGDCDRLTITRVVPSLGITRTSNGTVVVSSSAQTTVVSPQSATRVFVAPENPNVTVSPQLVRVVDVVGTGPQGPVGPSGPSTQGVPPIAFSYGDASGAIFTPSEAGTIVLVRLVITTGFDGTNPSLQLGTVAQPGAILSSAQNDPTTVAEYEHTPDLHLAALQSVVLTIVPGAGATQGNGTILLVFVPD